MVRGRATSYRCEFSRSTKLCNIGRIAVTIATDGVYMSAYSKAYSRLSSINHKSSSGDKIPERDVT